MGMNGSPKLVIDYTKVSGVSGKIGKQLGISTGSDYKALTSALSRSKGSYVKALKKEIEKEAAAVEAVQSLMKEIASMLEKASSDFHALDRGFSVSHIS